MIYTRKQSIKLRLTHQRNRKVRGETKDLTIRCLIDLLINILADGEPLFTLTECEEQVVNERQTN